MTQRLVKVINLGRMGFLPAYDIQTHYARQQLDYLTHKSGNPPEDTLLLVEHNPVYTVGIRREKYTERDEAKLKALGAEFFHTNRGGLITFHGPGQLVAYPILNLKNFNASLKWYVASLENTMTGLCKHYGLDAHTTEHTGVWVNDKKIGAIGVHASRFVTTHGISVNCTTDLDWYKHIVPCGVEGKGVTSLSNELSDEVSAYDAVKPLLLNFERFFECECEYSMLEEQDRQVLQIFQKHGIAADSQNQ